MADGLMVGRVHSVAGGVVRVTVPSIDGGARALEAFAAASLSAGDEVRVLQDETGGYVVVASRPT